MPIKQDREYRTMINPMSVPAFGEERNKRIDSDFYIEGYATTFNQPYEICDIGDQKYYEMIERSAIENADFSDVILLFDHAGIPYARISNKTLGVEADAHGLLTFADLSKTDRGKALFRDIQERMITRMSWSFKPKKVRFDEISRTFVISEIGKVFDVSACSIPANDATEISIRTMVDGAIETEKRLERARKIQRLRILLQLDRA